MEMANVQDEQIGSEPKLLRLQIRSGLVYFIVEQAWGKDPKELDKQITMRMDRQTEKLILNLTKTHERKTEKIVGIWIELEQNRRGLEKIREAADNKVGISDKHEKLSEEIEENWEITDELREESDEKREKIAFWPIQTPVKEIKLRKNGELKIPEQKEDSANGGKYTILFYYFLKNWLDKGQI